MARRPRRAPFLCGVRLLYAEEGRDAGMVFPCGIVIRMVLWYDAKKVIGQEVGRMELNQLPHYCGERQPNTDYHHGALPPVKGAGCFQVTRANRTHPEWDDGVGGTYKHGADLAFWNNTFYLHYFTNPVSEHTGAGQSILASSKDGMHWEDFQTAFPVYRIPACTVEDCEGNVHTFSGKTFAFIHQRVGFYRTKSDRMLLLGFYGWSPQPWITPWDNYGIGRVVRELYRDGTMGAIFFIRPCRQGGWSDRQLLYPLYTESEDPSFVACCEELLHDRLAVQQWAEENGDRDELILIKHGSDGKSNQAFCWYHIDEKKVIGLWKHSRAARSEDGGRTWGPVTVCPSLVMSGQKVWAQKTDDGRFAMVYDPTMESTHRWPLCVTTSEDGLAFRNMLLVHGEVPPMRFGGFWKDFGPQYMRGIAEGIARPQNEMWVAYTVNKEDVWVARLPVPISGTEEQRQVSADFTSGFSDFTIYSPKWAPVSLTQIPSLRLSDFDRYDYAKAERVLYPAKKLTVSFAVIPRQNTHGNLYCELQSETGHPAVRLIFREDGKLCVRTTAVIPVCAYQPDRPLSIKIQADCGTHRFTLAVDGGEERAFLCMASVERLSRFVLRTGAPRLSPTIEDLPREEADGGLLLCDKKDRAAVYDLTAFFAHSEE